MTITLRDYQLEAVDETFPASDVPAHAASGDPHGEPAGVLAAEAVDRAHRPA